MSMCKNTESPEMAIFIVTSEQSERKKGPKGCINVLFECLCNFLSWGGNAPFCVKYTELPAYTQCRNRFFRSNLTPRKIPHTDAIVKKSKYERLL